MVVVVYCEQPIKIHHMLADWYRFGLSVPVEKAIFIAVSSPKTRKMNRLIFLFSIIGSLLLASCSSSLLTGSASSSGGADAYVQLEQPVPPADAPVTDQSETDIAQQDVAPRPSKVFARKAGNLVRAIAKAPGKVASWREGAVADAQRQGASTLEIVLMVFLVLAILALLDWLLPGLFGSLLNLIISALALVLLILLILWLLGEL